MDLLKRPSTDFNAVRDRRMSLPLYIDVDLTNGGIRTLNIAGNSFYVDPDPVNSGFGTVFFEDTNLNGSTPFYVSGGFIANVPFTQLRIINSAQPGKRLRIFYGVDLDFTPGATNKLSIDGYVTVANSPVLLAAKNEATSGTSTLDLYTNGNFLVTNISGYLTVATASIANIEKNCVMFSQTVGADPWNTGGSSDDVILATLQYSHVAGANSVFKWKFEPNGNIYFAVAGYVKVYFAATPLTWAVNMSGIQN